VAAPLEYTPQAAHRPRCPAETVQEYDAP
jgi:hypothetical protein